MVIINFKAGQLANRLFYFAHFISNSLEYKYKLINPSFDEYNQFFTTTAANNFGDLDISVRLTPSEKLDSLLRNSLHALHKVVIPPIDNTPLYRFHNIKEYDLRSDAESHDDKSVCFDMNDPDFVAAARKKVVFVDGWLYRDFVNFEKHAPSLRKIFTPVPKYALEVQKILETARSKGDVVVGVHLRRGDFKNYNNGLWYYEDDVYYSKMVALQEELANQGRSCVFVMCSNEPINLDNYKGLTIVTDPKHYIIDLYSLAGCDYIIGPPSTFSMWASFYGETPLLHLNTSDRSVKFSEFEVVTQG